MMSFYEYRSLFNFNILGLFYGVLCFTTSHGAAKKEEEDMTIKLSAIRLTNEASFSIVLRHKAEKFRIRNLIHRLDRHERPKNQLTTRISIFAESFFFGFAFDLRGRFVGYDEVDIKDYMNS